MFFKDIPGHETIKKSLLRSVKTGRISHSQLFHGPAGSAKFALALAYARYISCTNRSENDSCGTCPSCIKFNQYAHPDLHFVFPATSRDGKVDKDKKTESENYIQKFREMLIENPYETEYSWYERIGMEKKQGIINKAESSGIIRKLNLKSYESEYKILIMWLPERMNPRSSNILLKIIEEPPPKTLFLFVSENPDLLLPTIISRTQLIRVPKFHDSEVEELLKRNFTSEDKEIKNAVRLANGNYHMAQASLSDGERNRENFTLFVSLMRLSYKKDVPSLMKWVEEISGPGRERQKNFLEYSLRLIRENLMMNMGNGDITHSADYEDEFSVKFSRFIHERNIEDIYRELNLAHSHISANGYGRIIFLDLCFKIIKYLHV